ncbi:C-terminal helicase domain-containing protein [Streptomyces sp. NPDC127049]|uniref:C-terminal helicase domain-containing protein n=1 Tax=Streptomyces sp. NPDC127049 TaxID=3347118 RepID=UPI003661C0A2
MGGNPRKLIVFTEHRDTLCCLQGKIGSLLRTADAVRAIHGGVRRAERRQIAEEFTKNRDVRILLATDAAGEGLNLQAVHLMINCDLPWNPSASSGASGVSIVSARRRSAGPAPYLDCAAAPDGAATGIVRGLPWLADAESRATSWIIANRLPDYLAEVQPRRLAELTRTRELVTRRLTSERERLLLDAATASEKERRGEKPRESSESLHRKAAELDVRLRKRIELLDRQQRMSTKPPRILTAALVLSLSDLPARE